MNGLPDNQVWCGNLNPAHGHRRHETQQAYVSTTACDRSAL